MVDALILTGFVSLMFWLIVLEWRAMSRPDLGSVRAEAQERLARGGALPYTDEPADFDWPNRGEVG